MSFNRWMDKKLWHIQTIKYYSVLKRNELLTHEKSWIKLKCILLSERSPSGKAKLWRQEKVPPSFSHLYPYICSLCLCLYFCLANRINYTIFSRFYIHVLTYNICFSLSDLIHFVWQSLGSPTSPQMTQFHSFLWPSNIPFIYVLHLLYPFVYWWTSRLLPRLAVVNSAAMNIRVHVSFWNSFLWEYA